MTDITETHRYLAKILRLPGYYGENLDALYDCLTEFDKDSLILIMNREAINANLGEYGDKLLDTFCGAAQEEDAFILHIR